MTRWAISALARAFADRAKDLGLTWSETIDLLSEAWGYGRGTTVYMGNTRNP
jgi:hypothetical protein